MYSTTEEAGVLRGDRLQPKAIPGTQGLTPKPLFCPVEHRNLRNGKLTFYS